MAIFVVEVLSVDSQTVEDDEDFDENEEDE